MADDVHALRELGDALVQEGKLPEAASALRQVLARQPDDVDARADLGHVLYSLGRTEEAIGLLSQTALRDPRNVSVLRSLVEMYRHSGELERALATAREIVHLEPDDVLATLEIAALSRSLGRLEDAAEAYARLRAVDPQPEHEVYALHGLIWVQMDRGEWRRALDHAIDATRIDRYALTTDLLAFIAARLFGSSERPVPAHADIEAALGAEQAEHRRLHAEALGAP